MCRGLDLTQDHLKMHKGGQINFFFLGGWAWGRVGGGSGWM